MHSIRGLLVTSSVAVVGFVGCNEILDNQRGELVVEEAGAPSDSSVSPSMTAEDGSGSAVVTSVPDAGAATPPDAGDEPPPPPCPTGQESCFGACVSLTDPFYGCGDPGCAPCPGAHGTMACQGRQCVVTACDPGFGDCNASSADGCETDFSLAASCGACNAVCGGATPFCSPSGASFHCTNGCTPAAPLRCGGACVDPSTSTSACGGCDVKCPAVANGTATCAGGVCGFTCQPTFHACGGTCVARTDPTACGAACTACPVPAGGVATCVGDACGITCTAPSHLCAGACVASDDPTACGAACTACPVPPNASATCAAGACGFTCRVGFDNCDANMLNGCETDLTSNPAHCGHCGTACTLLQTCVAGLCL